MRHPGVSSSAFVVRERWTSAAALRQGAVLTATAVACVILGAATPVEAKRAPCPAGRYLVKDKFLVSSLENPALDAVTLSGREVSTASGCDAVVAKVRATKKATVLLAKFASCRNVTGRVILSAKISSDCTAMTGRFTAKKASIVKAPFTATLSTCGDGIVDPGAGEECDGLDGVCVGGCDACRCVADGTPTPTTEVAITSTTSTTSAGSSSTTSTTAQPTATSTSLPASTSSTVATTSSTTSTSFTPSTLAGIVVWPGEVAIEPNGKCGLKEAIVNANKDAAEYADCPAGNGADTITLPPGTYDMSQPGEVAIARDLTINGADALTTILDGNDLVPVLRIDALAEKTPDGLPSADPVVVINDVTIRNGRGNRNGGGIQSLGANLTINRTIVTGNSAGDGPDAAPITFCRDDLCQTFAGDGGLGGGIFAVGTLVVNSSLIHDNHAGRGGAKGSTSGACPPKPWLCVPGELIECHCFAQSVEGNPGDGGGIFIQGHSVSALLLRLAPNILDLYAPASLTITNSVVSSNSGGGIVAKEAVYVVKDVQSIWGPIVQALVGQQLKPTDVSVSGCAFVGNTSTAIRLLGDGSKSIVNSTISRNEAGVRTKKNPPTLSYVTVANNGVGLDAPDGLYLKASIVADNGADLRGTITSQGANHVKDVTGGTLIKFLDIIGIDPGLMPLADNGASTWTQALSPGSPAIDVIAAGDFDCGVGITKDQRGYGPRPVNGKCDKGAFEVGAVPPPQPPPGP